MDTASSTTLVRYYQQEYVAKCVHVHVQVTIWGGIFPIVVTWWAALGLTVYYLATNNVLFYTRNVQHMQVCSPQA